MKKKRGFACMDKNKQQEIASKGGKAAHQKGTAHEFTSEEARIAGRKGGAARRQKLVPTSNVGGGSIVESGIASPASELSHTAAAA